MNTRLVLMVSMMMGFGVACGQQPIQKGSGGMVVINTTNGGSNNTSSNGTSSGTNSGTNGSTNNQAPTPDCAFGEQPQGSDCVPVDSYLAVSATVSHSVTSGGVNDQSTLSACFMQRKADGDPSQTFPGTVVDQQGACVAYQQTNTVPDVIFSPERADVGDISFDTPNGKVVMAQDGSTLCWSQDPTNASEIQVSGGDTVTVHVGGGADFPPFDGDITIPAAPHLQVGDLVPGQDLTYSWTSSGADNATLVLSAMNASQQMTMIRCEVDDSGSFTIPGSLTADLGDSITYAQHSLYVGSDSIQYPDNSMVALNGSATDTLAMQN